MSEIKYNTIARQQNDPTLSYHQCAFLCKGLLESYINGKMLNDDESYQSICQLLQEIDDHYETELANERADLVSLLGRMGRTYHYKPAPINVKEVPSI